MLQKTARLLFFIFLLGVFLAGGALSASAGDAVRWESSFVEARRLAQERERPVLLYLASSEPRLSDKMEDLFLDLGVIALSKNFLCAREEEAMAEPLLKQYAVSSLPAFVVLSAEGGRIGVLEALRARPSDLVTFLEKSLNSLKEAQNPQKSEKGRKKKKQKSAPPQYSVSFSSRNPEGSLVVNYPGCFFSEDGDIGFHLVMGHPASSSLEAVFRLPGPPEKVTLRIRHRTESSSQFAGWAPISILVNGNYALFHQDVGSDLFVVSEYDITRFCTRGENSIVWQLAPDSRTSYCIKEIIVDYQCEKESK